MSEYHKIDSVYKRSMNGPDKRLIFGEWSKPEYGLLADVEWEWTEKVDGTNVRVIFDCGVVSFGGRTDAAQMPVKLVSRLTHLFNARKLSSVFLSTPESGSVVLYGEGFGRGIQKGGEGYGDVQDFILFDVRVGSLWLMREDVDDIAEKLGIRSVPIVGAGTLREAIRRVAEGRFDVCTSRLRAGESEGLVVRPAVELLDRSGRRIIAKIKRRDFVALPQQDVVATQV